MGIVSFTDKGIEVDDRNFRAFGVDSFGAEASPYYLRWIRQDLIGAIYILSQIRILLVLIAIPLWMIALRFG